MTAAAGPGHAGGPQVGGEAPTGHAAPRRGVGEWVLEAVVTVLLTVLVAVAGTVVHRMESGGLPLGITLGIALALSGAVLVRAVCGTTALLAYGALGIGVVLLMTYWGPGEDVLVTSTPRAMLWILTMPLAAAIGWAAPRAWFSSSSVRFGHRRAAGTTGHDDERRDAPAHVDGGAGRDTRPHGEVQVGTDASAGTGTDASAGTPAVSDEGAGTQR
ncbi:hypothetical protein ACPYO6_15345 [Georgenia sp. Z1344]|uniref:hypothetical protein n=1 Tax=Georgenia sp. Z1344 TaxID=3416706 RepID=UPI003CF74441